MVGDGECFHAIFLGLGHEAFYAGGPVEERIMCVNVQVGVFSHLVDDQCFGVNNWAGLSLKLQACKNIVN